MADGSVSVKIGKLKKPNRGDDSISKAVQRQIRQFNTTNLDKKLLDNYKTSFLQAVGASKMTRSRANDFVKYIALQEQRKHPSLSDTFKRNYAIARQDEALVSKFNQYRPAFEEEHGRLTNKNMDRFASFVVEQEKIQRQNASLQKQKLAEERKTIKEKQRLDREQKRLEKEQEKQLKERLAREKRFNKSIENFATKTGKTLFNIGKKAAFAGSTGALALGYKTIGLYDDYTASHKYTHNKDQYANSLISKAKYSPYISSKEVDQEIAQYYQNQMQYVRRGYEPNKMLHTLGLNSAHDVKTVLDTIKVKYRDRDTQQQMARDVGLENAFLASLEKRNTIAENQVKLMEDTSKKFHALKTAATDILSSAALPAVNHVLTGANQILGADGSAAIGRKVAPAIGGTMGAGAGMWAGAKIGALLGSAFMPGVGTAVGGIAGAALGGAAGVGLGSYINDLVMPKNAETHRVNNNNINLTVNNNLNGVSNPDELVEAIGPSIKQVVAESLTAANEEQRWSEESTHFFHNGGTSYNS